jgi:hypothetical protein
LIFRRAPSPEAHLQSELARLQGRLAAGLASIRQEALASGPEGDEVWDRRLESLRIQPDTPEQRRKDALGGFSQCYGAPLREVERATIAWCDEIQEEVERLSDAHPFSSELRAFSQRLRHLAEKEAVAYAAEVKPRPTMDSVFATALGSSVRHMSKAEPRKMVTLRCRTCGSPRSHDQEIFCRYCGESLFG